jgi:hypothetical protein
VAAASALPANVSLERHGEGRLTADPSQIASRGYMRTGPGAALSTFVETLLNLIRLSGPSPPVPTATKILSPLAKRSALFEQRADPTIIRTGVVEDLDLSL